MPNDPKVLGYKIRNKNTNLYAISISKDKWGKTGRTWSRMCDVIRVLKNGIRHSKKYNKFGAKPLDVLSKEMLEWEIVELIENNSYSTMYCLDKLNV